MTTSCETSTTPQKPDFHASLARVKARSSSSTTKSLIQQTVNKFSSILNNPHAIEGDMLLAPSQIPVRQESSFEIKNKIDHNLKQKDLKSLSFRQLALDGSQTSGNVETENTTFYSFKNPQNQDNSLFMEPNENSFSSFGPGDFLKRKSTEENSSDTTQTGLKLPSLKAKKIQNCLSNCHIHDKYQPLNQQEYQTNPQNFVKSFLVVSLQKEQILKGACNFLKEKEVDRMGTIHSQKKEFQPNVKKNSTQNKDSNQQSISFSEIENEQNQMIDNQNKFSKRIPDNSVNSYHNLCNQIKRNSSQNTNIQKGLSSKLFSANFDQQSKPNQEKQSSKATFKSSTLPISFKDTYISKFNEKITHLIPNNQSHSYLPQKQLKLRDKIDANQINELHLILEKNHLISEGKEQINSQDCQTSQNLGYKELPNILKLRSTPTSASVFQSKINQNIQSPRNTKVFQLQQSICEIAQQLTFQEPQHTNIHLNSINLENIGNFGYTFGDEFMIQQIPRQADLTCLDQQNNYNFSKIVSLSFKRFLTLTKLHKRTSSSILDNLSNSDKKQRSNLLITTGKEKEKKFVIGEANRNSISPKFITLESNKNIINIPQLDSRTLLNNQNFPIKYDSIKSSLSSQRSRISIQRPHNICQSEASSPISRLTSRNCITATYLQNNKIQQVSAGLTKLGFNQQKKQQDNSKIPQNMVEQRNQLFLNEVHDQQHLELQRARSLSSRFPKDVFTLNVQKAKRLNRKSINTKQNTPRQIIDQLF